jgi:hypothetical protein
MKRCLLVAVAMLGCKGDRVQCEKAVRNYYSLVYWEQAEKDIAAAPAADRDKLRKDKLGKFEADMARGVDTVVSQCVSANNDDQVDCLLEAKTAPEAKACME